MMKMKLEEGGESDLWDWHVTGSLPPIKLPLTESPCKRRLADGPHTA